VHDFVLNTGVFNYKTTSEIILADELIQSGGDCKSWSTFYKSVFNYMGIDGRFIYTKNHIYLTVYEDNFYCNIDQRALDCYSLG
jgi:hypothetical protein